MTKILKDAVPALVALVGTVVAVLIGYRQWRIQQDSNRVSEYRSQKQQMYKELWGKLEDVHIRLRITVVGGDEFRLLVQDINSYILKGGLYLEKDDQRLVNQYLSQVREFTNMVAASDLTVAKEAVRLTAEYPVEAFKQFRDLQRIQAEVNEIRETIIVRFRKILVSDVSAK
jgi:hypothetical protein